MNTKSFERLSRAVERLKGDRLWLDDNRPWRMMLGNGAFNSAVAEAHPDILPDDGDWEDGDAICAIVNEAIRLCRSDPA